ncbi:MAG TPA: hypothetical protein VMF33_05065 [Acidimicrobiales bacterium]|nr:hypothetical protein [Acidimicrobiales bacterium]
MTALETFAAEALALDLALESVETDELEAPAALEAGGVGARVVSLRVDGWVGVVVGVDVRRVDDVVAL